MDKPTVGRIVHYVLDGGVSEGQVRPAIVVRVWEGSDPALVQLQVFTDETNDYPTQSTGIMWKTSVKYSEEPKPRTWHWPPRG